MVKKLTYLFLGILLCSSALSPANVSKFRNFSSLQEKISTIISAAKERVWLMSEFISDHDIALALYIAKFRKLDVRVVLSKEKLGSFLSQYRYLREHGIPVKIAAKLDKQSVLLCDNKLFRISSDLDFLTTKKEFTLTTVQKEAVNKFAKAPYWAFGFRSVSKVYDYSNKKHRRPNNISDKLPKKTIRSLNHKLSRGQS